jgi:hypothetical protein
MSGPDAETVARGLTKAQRDAVACPKAILIPAMGLNGHDTVILGFQHGKSARALHARGLAMLPWAPQILTPLGLAVRKILENDDAAK